jgi:hyaluronan synthase
MAGVKPGAGRRVLLTAAVAALVVVAAYRLLVWQFYGFSPAAVYFSLVAVYFLFMMFAAVGGGDRFEANEPATGRILAIIPSYNEEVENLHLAVRALLASTVVPDEIYVVDDGSSTPVVPFEHPRVRWLRQDNAGKRAAQASVLAVVRPGEFDFVVTIDSDSQVAPGAIESALRALADPTVHGVTSVVAVRNRTASIFARLADLEIISGVFVVRRGRARVGAVTPTSGAFSMYRADTILKNLYDYVRSGTFSDDRRMAHYCLLEGQVVAVDGAVVHTDMPTTFRGTWRQRVRWYKGYWKYLPWEAAHLSGWPLLMRYMSTLNALVFPLALFWVAVWLPATGKGLFWPVFALWLALLYCQSLTYLRRPGISRSTAVASWLLLTPLLIPYQLLLVRPAMYWAALTVGSERWDGHREPAPAQTTAT